MANLIAHVPLAELWVGPDFALGRGREGNTDRLAELGREMGFALRVVPPYDWRGEPVRSSRVRALLSEDGAVEQAAELLGRPYRLWGEVVAGAKRGRQLGFPTANLRIPEERLVPAFGVYACWAWRGDRGYPAVVNIGVRPSFDNGHPSVEAYPAGLLRRPVRRDAGPELRGPAARGEEVREHRRTDRANRRGRSAGEGNPGAAAGRAAERAARHGANWCTRQTGPST